MFSTTTSRVGDTCMLVRSRQAARTCSGEKRPAAPGLPVDLEQVETNFVQLDVGPLGIPRNEALDRLRDDGGVLLSTTVHPTVVRAVTHLDVSDADIDAASEAIPRALGVLARA